MDAFLLRGREEANVEMSILVLRTRIAILD